MKLRRIAPSLILLLLPSSILALATESPQKPDISLETRQVAREASPPEPPLTAILDASRLATSNVGTKDAPVDGKDGKPHAGPFVETAAERERKKAKGSEEEKGQSTGSKPVPRPLKGSQEGVSQPATSPIPESNDGVMDDPNRVAPKEGTRGTEGGVTEKDRDRKAQEGHIGVKPEKKPDPPKEAPPLPHSEEEELAAKEGKEVERKGRESSAVETEKTKAVGGLDVSVLAFLRITPKRRYEIDQCISNVCRRRNPPISRISRMIYLILFLLAHKKMIPWISASPSTSQHQSSRPRTKIQAALSTRHIHYFYH